jgi:hypothetical protein
MFCLSSRFQKITEITRLPKIPGTPYESFVAKFGIRPKNCQLDFLNSS